MRSLSLTRPLTELTRPTRFEDVVGAEGCPSCLEGSAVRAQPAACDPLRAAWGWKDRPLLALCLRRRRRARSRPSEQMPVFVEIDANTARFDDRGIADPSHRIRS